MAMALMIENLNNDFSVYSTRRSEVLPTGSYFKFYQSKLRQLLTQTRYRKEQEARIARQKQSKNSTNDNRLIDPRLHREYMNHIREKSKVQTQEILANKNDELKKRPESVLSSSNRTVTLSITSTSMESRPKIILKPKQTPTPAKQSRIISAPLSSPKVLNKPKSIPIIKIDCVDESLSTANIHSFTQVTSSSSQNSNNETFQQARQSILDAILSHLNSHIPSHTSLWPTFENIDNKFSSSIAPNVYRNFERIVV